MDNSKLCPFCGGIIECLDSNILLERVINCSTCRIYGIPLRIWDNRPLEDAKDIRIHELESALNKIANEIK